MSYAELAISGEVARSKSGKFHPSIIECHKEKLTARGFLFENDIAIYPNAYKLIRNKQTNKIEKIPYLNYTLVIVFMTFLFLCI